MEAVLSCNPYTAIEQPVPGAGDDRLRALLAWAVLAPSPHNTQPWSWSVGNGVMELRGDYLRLLTVSDPDGRELVIGCGCALEHLLLRLGLDADPVTVDLFPEAGDAHLFARVTVGRGSPYARHPDLVSAMALRRTNRTAYHGDPMDVELRVALEEACAAFGVEVAWVGPAVRPGLVTLIMDCDREQMASPAFRHELAHWMRPKGSRAEDGMEADLLGQKGLAAYVAPLVVRTFDLGSMQAARDEQLTEGSPDIALLSTVADDAAARLATGRALARFTLISTAAGRSSAYMNQPCEVPSARGQLASLAGIAGHPQLVIRLGLADPGHPALRFPVAEVLAD